MSNSFDPNAPISASHFMENLVKLYNDYWQDPVHDSLYPFAFDQNHTTHLARRKGWGQLPVEVKGIPQTHTLQTGMLVEREHLNTVIAQINAGLYHISNSNTLLLERPLSTNTSNLVTAQEFESVRSTVLGTINTNKNTCEHDANLMLADTITSSYDSGISSWSEDLQAVTKFSFVDYQHARHFFNGGGLLTINLDTDSSTGGASDYIWDEIFTSIGWIGVGAESTNSSGANRGINIGLNRGFYNLPHTSEFTTIFDAAGGYASDPNNTYAYAYAYIFVDSMYNSRRVRVEAKAEQSSTFDIYLRVTLLEDIDDTFPITTDIILSSGYKHPTDSPDATDNMPAPRGRLAVTGIPGVVQYYYGKNVTINPPIVSQHSVWFADDFGDSSQLNYVSGSYQQVGGNYYQTVTNTNSVQSGYVQSGYIQTSI